MATAVTLPAPAKAPGKQGTDPSYGKGGTIGQPPPPQVSRPAATPPPTGTPIDTPLPGIPTGAAARGTSTGGGTNRDRLAAAASGGTQALNDFDQAKKSIEGARKAAIAGITKDAALIHGGGTTASLAGLINEPAQRQEDALTAGSASYNAQQQAETNAVQRYTWEDALARNSMLAEMRAQAARTGGGSGGSGGRSGSGTTLTKAELGSALQNAAVQNRISELRSLLGNVKQGGSLLARATQSTAPAGTNDPAPVTASNRLEAANFAGQPQQQSAYTHHLSQEELQRQALEQAISQALGQAGKLLHANAPAKSRVNSYDQVPQLEALQQLVSSSLSGGRRLSQQPLYQSAEQIGQTVDPNIVKGGVSPALIASLVGPKNEKSLESALLATAPRLAKIYGIGQKASSTKAAAPHALSRQATDEALGVARQINKRNKAFPADATSVSNMLKATTVGNVLDANGNLQKDSAGNNKTTKANIVEQTLTYLTSPGSVAQKLQTIRGSAGYKANPNPYELAINIASANRG